MHSFYIHGARERLRKDERRLERNTGHYIGRDYVGRHKIMCPPSSKWEKVG